MDETNRAADAAGEPSGSFDGYGSGAPEKLARGDEGGGAPAEDPGSAGVRRELYDWAQAIVTAIVFVVILFTFFVRVTGIKGHSMMPTLQQGDKVLLSNLFYTPRHGDIVVLTKSSFMKDPIVKRVIATEGQTVFFDAVRHEVVVDGEPLDEPYINEITNLGGIISDKKVVPKGCIFVMGDNRNNSSDSRIPEIGMIDRRDILGKLLIRIYPLDMFGPV